jgi:SAM-dependent methyltransferase
MAITRHLAELILIEHLHRPIVGRVLLLGRQTVFMTPDEATALVGKVGLKVRPAARIDICGMPHGRKNGYISDAAFFSLFSDADVKACDVTDYEGAEYLFDLSQAPPPELLSGFSFIYNGSVLDNVFDPAAALRNVARMLKPDGVLLGYEGMVHWGAAYLKMSPDWFFDYFALNGFADTQAWVVNYPDIHAAPWQVFEWSPYSGQALAGNVAGPQDQMVVVVAENSATASVDRTPIQKEYRPDHAPYRAAYERMTLSARREHYARLIAASNPAASRDVPTRRSMFGLGGKPVPPPPGLRRLGMLGTPRRPEVWS